MECIHWYLFLVLNLSYNQPRFCPYQTWNPDATTFADNSTVGQHPFGIFVNSHNTVYVPNRSNGQIRIWMNDSKNPTETISGSLSNPLSIFVTTNGDIFVDNGGTNQRVNQWISKTKTWMTVMFVNSSCFGLFIDINHHLYCSMLNHHQVVKKWLNDTTNTTTIVAGTGIQGNGSDMLLRPHGIFVDINLDLYVADRGNHRVQRFRSGEQNGTTVVGNGSLRATITLKGPSGVILDGDNYLFIVDRSNHRIVGSDQHGFRCIVGCSGGGSLSNQLQLLTIMSFDSYGNIYVVDEFNNRIQKFNKNTLCGMLHSLCTNFPE